MTGDIFKGTIHGNIIKLDEEPGLPDGQTVIVKLNRPPVAQRSGEGLRRAFGGWAEGGESLDQFLEETRRLRHSPRREVEP